MIKIYLRENQKKWDEQLPEIQFAVNTAVQDSTGFSAAEMNFGRNLKPPKTFFEDETAGLSVPLNEEYNPKAKVEGILKVARENVAKAQKTQAKYYDKKRRNWSPKLNEVVYKRDFVQSKAAEGFAAKLAPTFSVPFKVFSYISPTIVEIQSASESGSGKLIRVHLKDLKQVNQENFSFTN